MHIGAISGTIDVAQAVLVTFFLFFVGLVIYLQRESNREGFPLRDHRNIAMRTQGLSGVPAPKAFVMPTGDVIYAPRGETFEPVNGVASAAFPGAPLEPLGNPLLSGTGPASFARRADVPDREFHSGAPRIVPLRADPSMSVAAEDHDPRGYLAVGADDAVAGTVIDLWFDRSESMLRYFEVRLVAELGGRSVLVPSTMADIQNKYKRIKVGLILGAQFADVPALKTPDQVTLLEEDKITGYFGGGLLWATPARAEPLI